jgi:hypothetical protein
MSKLISNTSADGINGVIMWSHDKYVFRVYDKSLPAWTFKEYDFVHQDLAVTINDPTAYLYEYTDGKITLDDHIVKMMDSVDKDLV